MPLTIVGGKLPLFDPGLAVRLPGIAFPLSALHPDARSEEIAIIAHELRNSLGVVRNATRLLRLNKSTVGIDSARLLIERHILLMSRHIEDLLDTSRPVGSARVLRRTHLDLRTIVEQCVAAIVPDLKRRGHRLVVSLPASPLWVHADGARLEQVFSNLLNNAAKYTPNGGEVAVVVERIDTHASVRIRDSGVGIAAELLPTVFGMYVQADAKAVRAEGGSGIGLAIVRNLVELHDGSVHAASGGLGAGSEFTVLLPVMWAPPVEGSPAVAPETN